MPASEHKPHHPAPEAVDLRSPRAGLQAIASVEAIKGVFVLAAGFGLLALLHRDLPEVADHLIHRIHLNPEGHLSQLFLRLADRGSEFHLVASFLNLALLTKAHIQPELEAGQGAVFQPAIACHLNNPDVCFWLGGHPMHLK